ncbi:hypothetical protein PENANT_c011G01591 [Penicillium antarcticum]|uniref:Uncharacterized protein n=1 Tax=Penicillium antarcticum TaxID=416450 RepID=A0A1V6Q6K8_9EURO|nr:hypothetical protein PENANT_c011G01591 [Penicillium antarcticum]
MANHGYHPPLANFYSLPPPFWYTPYSTSVEPNDSPALFQNTDVSFFKKEKASQTSARSPQNMPRIFMGCRSDYDLCRTWTSRH